MNRESLELTILMPCLNEAKTLPACIARAKKLLSDFSIRGECLVSDNGSTDGSQEIAQCLGARVVSCPVRGYGAALQYGIENAKGEFVLMGDSDDSYHFDEAFPMIEKLRQGYDVCMGTRLKGKIMPNAMPLLHRYLGNPVLTWLGQVLFGIKQSDFHCGMRAFRRDKILSLGLVTTGMEWASEMLIKSKLYGLKITEVPITLYKDGRDRPPHLRSWRDGWRHLRFMLLHAPNYLFLLPAFFFIVIGVLGQGILFIKPIKVGEVVLDLHSQLAFAFLVLVGVQVMFAGIFAKLYSYLQGILPMNEKFINSLKRFSLEKLLIVALFLIVLGLIGFGFTLYSWYDADFKALDYTVTMRKFIPSLTLLGVGVQCVFYGFMLSILFLKTKRNELQNLFP